ncbi:DNA-directed RNA polymerase subunit K [Candidatus Woesearchaeota archaeon CG10_big_fil_rev_8_21_14_0_10_45_16]|nr:MAG: DNA-directed RNA polymerase subunit K [Candidatus Woesearchaeota archaeon CG10_big_fil_rev_8_21_14_0_10_45_16]
MAKDNQEIKDFTKYEKARMIGSRALQLSMGAPFLLKLSPEELGKINYNPIEIALKEFAEGVLPITVKRPNQAA